LRFLTIGLGHCGGKIASAFKAAAKDERHLIVDVCGVNTDRVDLESHGEIPDENKLLVGSGRGAAKDWREGHRAGAEARDHLRNMIVKLLHPDTDIVMLTLGEGGGSGSGLAPIVAEVLGELGRECMALATLPFRKESVKAKVNAAKGLDLLYRQEPVKALVLIENDKIVAHYPDSSLTDAYAEVNGTAIRTFIGLLDLANTPSQADRIDESELRSIFGYPGFATLANHRTYANMVDGLDSMLRHSWEGSLFAEADPATAAGALLGVYGPSGLLTTTQVDRARRVLKETLLGRDATLGVYPVDRCRWVSYVGIMTGLDVPQKVRELLGTAMDEHRRHEEILEERRAQKAMGLGFQLPQEQRKRIVPSPRPRPVPLVDLERRAAFAAGGSVDISSTLTRVMEALENNATRRMADWELVDYIKRHVDATEDEVAACIVRLKEMGCIIEPRAGVLQVI
jgi:cell division GTPase FtsZ